MRFRLSRAPFPTGRNRAAPGRPHSLAPTCQPKPPCRTKARDWLGTGLAGGLGMHGSGMRLVERSSRGSAPRPTRLCHHHSQLSISLLRASRTPTELAVPWQRHRRGWHVKGLFQPSRATGLKRHLNIELFYFRPHNLVLYTCTSWFIEMRPRFDFVWGIQTRPRIRTIVTALTRGRRVPCSHPRLTTGHFTLSTDFSRQ